MEYLFFVPIVAFLGLVAGILLTKTVIEERIPGRKYFRLMKRVVLFVLLISILYYAKGNYLVLFFGVILGFLIGIFAEEYVVIGISLATAFLFLKETVFLVAVLVFLYGLPYGTLHGKRNVVSFLVKNGIYFFVPFLILLFNFNEAMIEFVVGVCSGGLFSLFIKRQ